MRVRLKGLKRVASGSPTAGSCGYWYAWRGGPRLDGEPGSTEFMLAYNRAIAEGSPRNAGTLDSILDKFQDSDAFLSSASRTQSDYRKLLRAIANEFGDFPLAALLDESARGSFIDVVMVLRSALTGRPILPGAFWPGHFHGRLIGD